MNVFRYVRSAAAAATADFAVDPKGREILRQEGALRPLVLLVEEGIESPAAEQAAKALMTLAASEINKAGADSSSHTNPPSDWWSSKKLLAYRQHLLAGCNQTS